MKKTQVKKLEMENEGEGGCQGGKAPRGSLEIYRESDWGRVWERMWKRENENTLHGAPVPILVPILVPNPLPRINPTFPTFPTSPITRAQDHIPPLPPTFSHHVPLPPTIPLRTLCVPLCFAIIPPNNCLGYLKLSVLVISDTLLWIPLSF